MKTITTFYRLTNPDAGPSSPYGYLFRSKARCEWQVSAANHGNGRLNRTDWFARAEEWDKPDDADLYDDDERHGLKFQSEERA